MLSNEYRLDTRLGAYLSEKRHFFPNRRLGFVTVKFLKAAADASGNAGTLADHFLTVNGCLATEDQWQAFDIEWQEYLKDRGFRRDPRTQKYVFHTSTFWADKFDLAPRGLTYIEKQRLYRHLIDIIVKHTEYRFGWGVSLVDFRKLVDEWPFVDGYFKQPGTFLCHRCFDANQTWAAAKGFDSKIDYVFDRGDSFWKELFKQYREAVDEDVDNMKIGNLDKRNKAEYSPIQAADVVAWECQRYFRTLTEHQLSGVHTVLPRPRFELNKFAGTQPDRVGVSLKAYQHLDEERRYIVHQVVLTAHGEGTMLVGPGTEFETEDDFARHWVELDKTEEAKAWKKENKSK